MEQNRSQSPCPSVARPLPGATNAPGEGIWELHCTKARSTPVSVQADFTAPQDTGLGPDWKEEQSFHECGFDLMLQGTV